MSLTSRSPALATTEANAAARSRIARALRPLAAVALVLVVVYLVWRGVLRATRDSEDLAVGFAAARAWWLGLDPYAVPNLNAVLVDAGGGGLVVGRLLEGLRNVYFPTTLPVFLPVAVGTWPLAWQLLLSLNVAGSAVMALGLVRIIGWRIQETRAVFLSAAILALGPLHLTMALGQTGIVATAGLILAILLERSGRPRLAGALYGLATAVKVQIGLPFVAYLVWRRRWPTLVTASAVLVGLTALSIGRMTVASADWFESWMANLAVLSGPGGVNDPSQQNPERYSLVNLQYPLGSLGVDAGAADLVTLAAVGAAALLTVWLIRGSTLGDELLALSIAAVLGLLVTYHRYYDAVLVALPIAWGFFALGTRLWRQGVFVLVLCLDFIVPILGALITVQRNGWLPAAITESPIWQIGLLSSHSWTLVLLAVVLLWVAARESRRPVPSERAALPPFA